MTSIAIVGANGRLGQAATLAFHQAGYRVIAVSRNGNLNLPALFLLDFVSILPIVYRGSYGRFKGY